VCIMVQTVCTRFDAPEIVPGVEVAEHMHALLIECNAWVIAPR
jgi:hypothetical protein